MRALGLVAAAIVAMIVLAVAILYVTVESSRKGPRVVHAYVAEWPGHAPVTTLSWPQGSACGLYIESLDGPTYRCVTNVMMSRVDLPGKIAQEAIRAR